MRFLILFISLFIFIGCKKYPEDKNVVHFQQAKNRLWRGNSWYITGYKVNGVDSMAYLNSYYNWYAPISELGQQIRKNDLIDNGKKLMFGWAHVGKSSPTKNIWEIKRLDKNILWLEQVGYNNVIYRLELKGSQ